MGDRDRLRFAPPCPAITEILFWLRTLSCNCQRGAVETQQIDSLNALGAAIGIYNVSKIADANALGLCAAENSTAARRSNDNLGPCSTISTMASAMARGLVVSTTLPRPSSRTMAPITPKSCVSTGFPARAAHIKTPLEPTKR